MHTAVNHMIYSKNKLASVDLQVDLAEVHTCMLIVILLFLLTIATMIDSRTPV